MLYNIDMKEQLYQKHNEEYSKIFIFKLYSKF